ncbi:MAG TPA: crotonase/enoyl-CoA hydratase family protein [Ottowia sp.]|uniref:crotonase/enoyl-CoA hydratase family protein n=1 Tax=Ottowia sp. TaxID=1898956 RepID=UPI002C637B6C|nr:crotonase/enoyl-CoA hydratase family protein [Ottowia sp.]HMN22518.1 crotonase/enoyl-CoA hydratase family protein [Ottowia sp.]
MNIDIDADGPVTIVTLQRPDVRNAVDHDTALALHRAFIAFEADAGARVAVLHGAHGHFCAGWDLKSGARMASADGASIRNLQADLDFDASDRQPRGPMGPSRLLLSKPVIAAVEGAAVAGGTELALWCDLRVMAEDAYFGVYCRRFGVPLIDGGTVRLPRLIGQGRALDLILTGRRVDAAEALAIGLANRVVPAGQTRAAALALARQLAEFPQDTLRADRMSTLTQWDWPLPQALQREWERGRQCLGAALDGAARFAAGAGRHGEGN